MLVNCNSSGVLTRIESKWGRVDQRLIERFIELGSLLRIFDFFRMRVDITSAPPFGSTSFQFGKCRWNAIENNGTFSAGLGT